MKDAIIVALILAVALLGFGRSPRPEAAIQDTTLVAPPIPANRAARAVLPTPAQQQGIPDDARAVLQRCYPVAPESAQPLAAIGLEQEPVT